MKSFSRFLLVSIFLVSLIHVSYAQSRREINIPDIAGYKTYKCDFHMHTVFSDGLVWPTVRVEEAWKEGLDVISITDHIEYLPHEEYVRTNHNNAYEIAKSKADEYDITLIRGTEITRSMPPGHMNAIFIKDASRLQLENVEDVFIEAKKQNALVFWNHPGWDAQAPDSTIWYELHTEFLDKGYFSGIEVSNYNEWYPKAIKWALEKDLIIFGNSDVHNTAPDYLDRMGADHRVMTLVFAKDKSPEGIREALENRRSVVWIQDTLIGKEEHLKALWDASVNSELLNSGKKIKLTNNSDLSFILDLNKDDSRIIILAAGSSVLLNNNSGNKSIKNVSISNLKTGEKSVLKLDLTKI